MNIVCTESGLFVELIKAVFINEPYVHVQGFVWVFFLSCTQAGNFAETLRLSPQASYA